MLDKVWLLPAISAGAFAIILFFGKKLPFRGAEVGIAAISANFVMACIAAVNWVNRGPGAPHEPAGEGAEGAGHAAEEVTEHALGLGRGLGRFVARFAEAAEGEAHALREPVRRVFTWYRDGNVDITLGWHVDGFTVAMLFVVAAISLTVHIFSYEYMRTDSRFTHYYAALALFTGAMFLMVISTSTLQLLFGWELMGLCSFLLIGHWWEEQPNTNAALKAFFTTRTGDIGLLVGIIILFFAAGNTFDIATINEKALNGEISHLVLLVAACSLFAGVVGKSAQFPLHTWLPDAMAGPTPASSLIHAATMVVAGVYLFGRVYGVFWEGFSIEAGGMNLGAWIGSITLVMAAGLAFVQTDIKKVLAYSTVSQLGYMVMGLAVGAWTGAIFHLATHAFFKALLFQGAGSISHSGSHHSFEMERMGGLRKYMPITFATFTVGYLALAGIIPFAGFWSKDEILLGATKNGYTLAFAAGCVGAFMTGCYMTRVMWKTFFGENRLHLFHDEHGGAHGAHGAHGVHDDDAEATHFAHAEEEAAAHAVAAHGAHGAHGGHDAGHAGGAHGGGAHGGGHDEGPHESNWWILGPLVGLAVFSALFGLINSPLLGTKFTKWTENLVAEETVLAAHFEHPFNWSVAGPSIVIALAGIAVGYWYNAVKQGDLGLVRRGGIFAVGYNFLKNKYYLDHLWTGVVVGGIKGPIAKAAYWVNQNVLDGAVNAAGKGAVKTGRIVYDYVDQRGVDGIVNGAGRSSSGIGQIIRKVQTGKVQNYAAIFLGAVGLAGLGLALFV